jgi:hypothetical protein
VKRPRTDILAPTAKPRPVAYPFVLDALEDHEPTTRPLFGSTAVYLGERVFFILRQKGDSDDGVWVAFDEDREADALAALPNMTRITRLPNVRCWRKLAASRPSFEDDVLEACRLAGAADGPLGKIPVRQKARRGKKPSAKSPAPPKARRAAKKSTAKKKRKSRA